MSQLLTKIIPMLGRAMRAGKKTTLALGVLALALVIYWLTNPVQAIRTFESIGYWQNWTIESNVMEINNIKKVPSKAQNFPNP